MKIPNQITKRSWSQYLAFNSAYDTPKMLEFFKNPDISLQGKILKIDTSVKVDSTIVSLFEINNQSFVVKKYNIKSFIHGLKKCLWRTRAKKCWISSHRLLKLGLATPKPIAMVEKRFGPFRRESYYIYEYNFGTNLKELFFEISIQNIKAHSYIHLLIDTLKKFQKNKIYHGDMKLQNFLIQDNKLIILDLDSMRFYHSKKLFNYHYQKDLKHLIRVNFKDKRNLATSLTEYLKEVKLLNSFTQNLNPL